MFFAKNSKGFRIANSGILVVPCGLIHIFEERLGILDMDVDKAEITDTGGLMVYATTIDLSMYIAIAENCV